MHAGMYECMYVFVNIDMCVPMFVYMDTYIHVCIYIYIYIYIFTPPQQTKKLSINLKFMILVENHHPYQIQSFVYYLFVIILRLSFSMLIYPSLCNIWQLFHLISHVLS